MSATIDPGPVHDADVTLNVIGAADTSSDTTAGTNAALTANPARNFAETPIANTTHSPKRGPHVPTISFKRG